jgi:hypothetical protein
MSQQQRDALDGLLRDAPLDLGGDVAEQRVIFEDMMAAIPSPADVTTSSGSLGGIPVGEFLRGHIGGRVKPGSGRRVAGSLIC